MFTAQVVSTTRRSPSFQRVTVASPELAEFEWSGLDHWFRLFLPPRPGAPLVLPVIRGGSWYKPYLAIPDHARPHCSNYTVASMRPISGGAEMDIDVVLHWNETGAMAGPVAIWATSVLDGSPVALLDQGPLFDPPRDTQDIHLVSDETGVPALRGILRDLPSEATGTAIIEVPDAGDVQDLKRPVGVEVIWILRPERHTLPGAAALDALSSRISPKPKDYAFVVGESTLTTEGRRRLHRAGLAKSRITFSGFWKHDPVNQ